MKTIRYTVCCLLFCAIYINRLLGQDVLRMEITDPEPRVGDEVTISIESTFFFNMIKAELDSNISLGFTMDNKIESMDIEITFSDTGTVTLGPYQMTMNGKTFTTSTLTVHVIPALPDVEGVWVRYVQSESGQYIVIDQNISNDNLAKMTKKEKSDPNEFSYFAENNGFVKLNPNFDEAGFDVDFRRSKSSSSGGMNQFKAIYTVGFTDDYSTPYTLSNKDFSNLPKGVNIPEIRIKQ